MAQKGNSRKMTSTDKDSQLLDYIDDHSEELIEFVVQLVATPSTNPPGEEQRIAQVIVDQLASLGLGEPEVVTKTEGRPNLLYSIKGPKKGRRLLFTGHTDTKPVGDLDAWKTDPFVATIRDGNMYGIGTSDMKAACAALGYAMAAVANVTELLVGELIVAFTADEEGGCANGASYLTRNYGLSADFAMIGEPAGVFKPWEVIPLVSRGTCAFTIRVHGTQMHSSIMDLQPSTNASVKMAKILSRIEDELDIHSVPHPFVPQGTTLNAGAMVNGGVYYGVTSGFAEFSSDLRLVPQMTLEGVRKDIEAFLDKLRSEDPELRVELVFEREEHWLPAQEVSQDEPFVGILSKAAEEILGFGPPLGAVPFTTEARYFQGVSGIPTIAGFGPGIISVCHAPNEYIPVKEIVSAAKIYALAALRYLS